MIRFQDVSLMRGTKSLFDSANVTLYPGEKIGLIGPNGAGKTSLFSMLYGELHPDQGELYLPDQWRIAYVAQETPTLNQIALEYVIDGDTTLRQLEAQLAALEAQADSSKGISDKPGERDEGQDAPHAANETYHGDRRVCEYGATQPFARAVSLSDVTKNGLQIGELHSALADAGAYTVKARAEELLLGLGFTLEQTKQPVSSFSGGWQMRLNLAQALLCPSDLMLLDEPTNHLDLDAIIWLEDWLKRYAGTLVVISHDRDFLDGIVNVILHVNENKLKRYTGNYSSFERQRAEQIVLLQKTIEKQSHQRAHWESFISRFKAKATKARQVQSRIKALEKMEELAPLRAAAEFSFEFREPLSAPNPLLVMEDVNAGYRIDNPDNPNNSAPEYKTIVSGINFSIQTGERIGLLGVNGAGKSTLIKTIAEELAPVSGKMNTGKGLNIGYFAQHQVEMLRSDESPLWHLSKIAPDTREQDLRNFLGSFLFSGAMATNPIAPLSGGEKARLALALIVWKRPNLLLLDEPTNHLDLDTREALTEALAQFEGTLLLVSHDRHLLRATTDRFMIVAEGALQPFDGDLDDYRNWLFQTRLNKDGEAASPSFDSDNTAINRRDKKREEAEERQRLSAQRKPVESRIRWLETEINKHHTQKEKIEAQLADPGIYENANKEKLKTLLREQVDCLKKLAELEEGWLEKQEELEQISIVL